MKFLVAGLLAGLLAIGSAHVEHTQHIEDHADPNVDVVVDVYEEDPNEFQDLPLGEEEHFEQTDIEVTDEFGEPEVEVQVVKGRTAQPKKQACCGKQEQGWAGKQEKPCCDKQQQKPCPCAAKKAAETQQTNKKWKVVQEEQVKPGKWQQTNEWKVAEEKGKGKYGKQNSNTKQQWGSRNAEPAKQQKAQSESQKSTVHIEHHVEAPTQSRQGGKGQRQQQTRQQPRQQKQGQQQQYTQNQKHGGWKGKGQYQNSKHGGHGHQQHGGHGQKYGHGKHGHHGQKHGGWNQQL